jgi:hypothetical protein
MCALCGPSLVAVTPKKSTKGGKAVARALCVPPRRRVVRKSRFSRRSQNTVSLCECRYSYCVLMNAPPGTLRVLSLPPLAEGQSCTHMMGTALTEGVKSGAEVLHAHSHGLCFACCHSELTLFCAPQINGTSCARHSGFDGRRHLSFLPGEQSPY